MDERGKNINTQGGDEQRKWVNLKNNIRTVAKELNLIKKIRMGDNLGALEQDIRAKRKNVWEKLKIWLKTKSSTDKEELKKERNELKKMIKEKEKEKSGEKLEMVARSKNINEFWKALKNFSPRKRRKGEAISKNEWTKHFKALLGADENIEQIREGEKQEGKQIETIGDREMNEEINAWEVKKALGKMKSNKAAGDDGLKIEFMKMLPLNWLVELTKILNGLWNKGEILQGWDTARICPIYKAGNENDASNYRGVLDTGYKILTNIMNDRLKEWLERNKILKESQAGFREGRSTRDHLFVINSLIGNRLKNKGGKLYAALIDFKAAFDKVDRQIMIRKLEAIGVKGKVLIMIKRIYRETRNEIITNEGITEKFATCKGVRQGFR